MNSRDRLASSLDSESSPSSKPEQMRAGSGRLRFAVDTGGTFTDLIVADDNGGIAMFKAPTQPADPVAGVLEVMGAAARMRPAFRSSDYLARGEILVARHYACDQRDRNGSNRANRLSDDGGPSGYAGLSRGRSAGRLQFHGALPCAIRAQGADLRDSRSGFLSDGSVHAPLDEIGAVVEVLRRVAALGVEAVAVCLLWSVVNPTHEIALGILIERHLPGVPFTLSHQINPSIREYRRAMSTALDASLKPVMSVYMSGLESRLRDAGFAGRILVVTSQGGVMDAADVAAAPVHLINSGPSMAPFRRQGLYAGWRNRGR